MRFLRIHHTMPALLLAAATLTVGAAAHAAGGSDFQYVGQDDRVHGLGAPVGCVEAEGGGARPVTNGTRRTVTLYREPGCTGPAVAVLSPGTVTQVRPYFASARFTVTR